MTLSPLNQSVLVTDLGKEYGLLREEIDEAVHRVLSSGSYILGPESQAFEKDLAAYCGTGFAVGVNSGTDAILLALRALDIKANDEVIVPAMTFIATAEPVAQLGARPIFVDIDPVSYTMDPSAVRQKLSPRTKAIIAVHLYGQPADLDELSRIAKEAHVPLIEDMAQAIGSEYRGKKVGSFGLMACLSFFPTKNLGACGDGGAVLTSSRDLSERLNSLRGHGAKVKYHHEEVGYNTRLDDLQAAILRVKLKHLDAWNSKRRTFAAAYGTSLTASPLQLPKELPERLHTYHLYAVKAPERDALRSFLDKRQIASGLHYPLPLHLQPAFAYLGEKAGAYPESEALADNMVSLPLYPHMGAGDVAAVAAAINEFYASPLINRPSL